MKKQRLQNMRGDFANIRDSIVMMYHCDRALFISKMLITVVQSVLPLMSLYVLKLLIDFVTASIGAGELQVAGVVRYVLFFCGIFLFTRLMSLCARLVNTFFTQKLSDHISNALHMKSAELDLSYYDNSAYHDTFHRAQQEASFRPIQILNCFTSITGSFISLAGTVVILSSFSWAVIIIMLFACLPDFLVRLYKSRKIYTWNKDHTELFRMANYTSALLTNRNSAKEIRIFSLADHLRGKFNGLRKEIRQQIIKINMRLTVLDVTAVIFEATALFFIVLMLINGTIAGAITIGGFVMLFEAFRKGQSYVESAIGGITGLYDNKLFLRNLFEFLKLTPKIFSPEKPVSFPEKITSGIEFRNVSFSYPDSYKQVLKDFSLSAKPGIITHLEGENGFGKTTLIKLLFRLYDCDEGEILIDGTNIKEFDLKELRSNISAVLQDFMQYNLSVKENISFGDIDRRCTEAEVSKAAGMSTAADFIEKFPKGYDTNLGRYFAESEDLSMGQWQRIALARAFYSKAPILVLDEPTSWMDKKSTEIFYNTIEELQKDRIIILVTHK